MVNVPNRSTAIQFIKYGLMGVSNTLIDFGMYYVLTRFSSFFGTYIFVAKAISFCVATIWSYYGNKRWTFGQLNKSTTKEVGRFYVTALISGVINVSVHYVVVRVFNLPDTFGIVCAAGATVLFGFVLNKWWVFTETSDTSK